MADWLMVALTAVYVIATIFICFFNYRSAKASREQASEMKRQYDDEDRPYITVELIYEKKAFYGLRFTNHGKRLASHVRIQLEQDFLDCLTENSFKSQLEKQKGRECIIGIGKDYDLFFATNEIRENLPKAPLSGQVSYCDGRKSYSDVFKIDLDTYATFFSVNSDMDELLKGIKAQAKELKMIREALTYTSNISHNEMNHEDL